MKRTGIDHPKMRHLANLLGVKVCHAVGLMECLYHFAAKHAMRGDIGKWQDPEICCAVYWPEAESERLLDALVRAKLVDRCAQHRFIIHDWHEHCEDSVHLMLARRRELFASGAMPSLTRLSKDERAQALADYERKASDRRPARTRRAHKSTHDDTEPAQDATKNALPKPRLSLSHATPEPSLSHATPVVSTQACEGVTEGQCAPTESEFLDTWNATDGNVKARQLTDKRLAAFKARVKDRWWCEHWRKSLEKFPLKFVESNPDGWKPDIEWFLRPDSVTLILEGKYDWKKTDGKRPLFQQPGAGQRHDPNSGLGPV